MTTFTEEKRIFTAAELLDDLNSFVSNRPDDVTDDQFTDGKAALMARIQNALDQENAKKVESFVSDMLKKEEESKLSFWTEFLDHRECTISVLAEDKKNGGYRFAEKARRVSFMKLEKALQRKYGKQDADGKIKPDVTRTLVFNKHFYGMLSLFATNILLSIKGENFVVDKSVNLKSVPTEKMVDGIDFSKRSMKDLEAQLRGVVSALLPDGYDTPKMLRADVKSIDMKAFKAKGENTFKLEAEARLIEAILDAINTRRAEKDYLLKSSCNIHKEAKEEK